MELFAQTETNKRRFIPPSDRLTVRWHNFILNIIHNVLADLFYSVLDYKEYDANYSNHSNFVVNNNNTLRQTYSEGSMKRKHINLFFGVNHIRETIVTL